MWFRRKFTWIGLLVVMLAGCGSFAYHRVQPGETLYSISWRYGLDYREVAGWNDLKPPYTIFNGQQLRLTPSVGRRKAPATGNRTPQAAPVVIPPSRSAKISNTASVPIRWQWPARGSLLNSFSDADIARKGIDIAGKTGQAVNAAAAGHVVYAGSGLLNYGKLIILKHDDNYLSAYAYNQDLLVKEGDVVVAGQHIADMGQKTMGGAMLHFEIRYDGRPIDPLKYLPAKRQ